MAEVVNVIIPFYGSAQSARLNLATQSILEQEGVDVNLVVAGINTATNIRSLACLARHPQESVPGIVRVGVLINNGLRNANDGFVYVSDADIVLANPAHLQLLVGESSMAGTALKRPPMRRLLLQDYDWFSEQVEERGLENAIAGLDTSQEYIVKPRGADRPMQVFPKFENRKHKVFIASEADFQEYISHEANKGSEPRYFNQDRHCGAVFAPTQAFREVGGYHEGFISWGVWDADTQWKLENRTGMKLIPNREEFSVIHLDHEKGYFSKEKWEHDKKLQIKRRSIGAEECIERDRKDYLGRENVH